MTNNNHIQCAGGIVTNKGSSKVILLVKQSNESWSFPKGTIKKGEETLTAAKREILEEAGIQNITLIKKLGTYQRPHGDDPSKIKEITLFLFETEEKDLDPQDIGIQKAMWIEAKKVSETLTYPEDRSFFEKFSF